MNKIYNSKSHGQYNKNGLNHKSIVKPLPNTIPIGPTGLNPQMKSMDGPTGLNEPLKPLDSPTGLNEPIKLLDGPTGNIQQKSINPYVNINQ
jgi:hypothetical protein